MSDDKVRTPEITPAGAQDRNVFEVDLARRRALIQTGWAVPTILAVGLLPGKAKAIDPYGTAPDTVSGPFTNLAEADEALQSCVASGHTCFQTTTVDIVNDEPVQLFFVIDP